MSELIDLYNNLRQPVKTVERGQPFVIGLNKLSVHVWFINNKGEYLLQQRMPNAKKFPNMWGQTGGGAHAGETSWECCVRESQEELGITPLAANATLVGTFKRPKDFVDVWMINQEIDNKHIVLQPDEVQATQWASVNKIKEMQQAGIFIPSIVPGLQMIINYINMMEKFRN